MTMKLQIRTCPSCGDAIKKVRKRWTGATAGREYTVPSLEFYECPACGEKVYDAAAMQRIEAAAAAVTTPKRHTVSV